MAKGACPRTARDNRFAGPGPTEGKNDLKNTYLIVKWVLRMSFQLDVHVNQIRQQLSQLRDEQYKKMGYTPVKALYQNRKERDTNSNFHLNQFCRLLNIPDPNDLVQNTIDITSVEHYNIVEDRGDYIPWNKLDKEKRVKLLEEFFNSSDIIYPEEIKDNIITLCQGGKLKRKCDIEYDMINQHVRKIHVIKIDDDEN